MKTEHKITNGDIEFWERHLQAQNKLHDLEYDPLCQQLLKLAKAVKEIQDQETIEK